VALAGAIVAEVLWLALLYPLVPATTTAWLLTLVFPAAVGVYTWGTLAFLLGSVWPPGPVWFQRALSILLAISPGLVLFVGLYFMQRALSGQFRYWL
jgi:hypothetical protein